MAGLDLVCVGDFYRDFIFYGLERVPALGEELKTRNFLHSPGGGAVITALAARGLGLKTGLVTIVGKASHEGDLAPLRAARVDTRYCYTHPKAETGVTVAVSTNSDRYFLTHTGANEDLEKLLPRNVFPYLAKARHIHLALTPARVAFWASLLKRLAARGITASWDPGWNPELAQRPGVDALLKAVDILFLNEVEGKHWASRYTPYDILITMAKRVLVPVLRLGSKGSAAWGSSAGFVQSPAAPVHAAETTGAGDAFNAGFLTAYLGGASLQDCLKAGNHAGARRVSARGRR